MKIFFFCLFLCLKSHAAVEHQQGAKKTINSYEIPGLFYKGKDEKYYGEFYQLLKTVQKQLNMNIHINVLPARRSLRQFLKGNGIAFFPATSNILEVPKFKTCKSQQVAWKKDFIFFRTDSPANSLKDIEGRTVGITRGYPYDHNHLKKYKINLIEVDSDQVGLKMLSLKRLDYFILEEISGIIALKDTKLTNISYDQEAPLSNQKGFFLFNAQTESGKILCKETQKIMKRLIKQGAWSFEKISNNIRDGYLKMRQNNLKVDDAKEHP